MVDTAGTAASCPKAILMLAALMLSGWGSIQDLTQPTLQDMRVAGHVLGFQESTAAGEVIVAVVYNAAETRSHDEAIASASLLVGGLSVGGLVLQPCLVEQGHLAEPAGYSAIFATIGVDEGLLAAGVKRHHVPCLTRHLEQVEHGACTVAIRTDPSVSIVVNQANAVIAGVHFATAFRMMVREI
jgi:hypothetical protein